MLQYKVTHKTRPKSDILLIFKVNYEKIVPFNILIAKIEQILNYHKLLTLFIILIIKFGIKKLYAHNDS